MSARPLYSSSENSENQKNKTSKTLWRKTSDSPQLTFIIWQSGLHLIKASVGLRASVSAHMCVFLQCKHMPSPICCLIEAASFPAQPASEPASQASCTALLRGGRVGATLPHSLGRKPRFRNAHTGTTRPPFATQTQSPLLLPSFLLNFLSLFLSFVNFTLPL